MVRDRLFELQVEEGLPVYVLPLEPIERVMKQMQRRAESTRRWAGRAVQPE